MKLLVNSCMISLLKHDALYYKKVKVKICMYIYIYNPMVLLHLDLVGEGAKNHNINLSFICLNGKS